MRILVLIVCLLVGHTAFSQNGIVLFLKNNGDIVRVKDSADFIRVVQGPDTASVFYKIEDYYPNNIKKLVGSASVVLPTIVWEGQQITFDKNGKKTAFVTYNKNSPVGSAYYFYPSGKLMKELHYSDSGAQVLGNKSPKYKVVNYFDSTGVQLVKDGTGYLKETPNKYDVEEGNYVNGERDGLWKGTMANYGAYEEIYRNGQFISGKNFRQDGKIIEYTIKETLPKFPGGEKAFGQFLSNNIKYPTEARKLGISGRVMLSFVVQTDGELSDVTVLKSPHPSLEEEALRILRRSPKWEPGVQHGVPVKYKYTLPISFRL